MRIAKAKVCMVDPLGNFTVLENLGATPLDRAAAETLLEQKFRYSSPPRDEGELAKIKHEEKRLLIGSGDITKKLQFESISFEPSAVFTEVWESTGLNPREAFYKCEDGEDAEDNESKAARLISAAMKETGVESFRDLHDKLDSKKVCFFRRKFNPESDSDEESDDEESREWLHRALVPPYWGDVIGPVIIY